MAQATNLARDVIAQAKPAAYRCVGALAGTLGASASEFERFRVSGATSITVRTKGAVTGTVTLRIYPMLSDAHNDDTVGARAATGLPTAVVVANATEATISYTLKGEDYVEVDVTTSGGAAWAPTYTDIFVT